MFSTTSLFDLENNIDLDFAFKVGLMRRSRNVACMAEMFIRIIIGKPACKRRLGTKRIGLQSES